MTLYYERQFREQKLNYMSSCHDANALCAHYCYLADL